MSIYGYCRVSTRHQSINRQEQDIKILFGENVFCFKEAFTGTKIDRPEWNRLMKRVKPGDTIVFDEVSRMSRNADEGFATYKQLMENGIHLVFLKERSMDTDNFKAVQQIALVGNEIADAYIETTNRVLWMLAEQQIRAAFMGAEHEVQMLHTRTQRGMETAKAGKKISAARQGRKFETQKSRDAKKAIREKSKSFDGSYTDTDLIKVLGINRNTFYRYKREMVAEETKKGNA